MVHAEHLNLIALAKQTTLTYTLWTSYVGIWGGLLQAAEQHILRKATTCCWAQKNTLMSTSTKLASCII